jgi:hypothetical protein
MRSTASIPTHYRGALTIWTWKRRRSPTNQCGNTPTMGSGSFSVRGRVHVRKLIHEEHSRQLDIKYGFFTRIILPTFGFLVGLIIRSIGARTGYLAVKQKSQQKTTPPQQQQQHFEPSDRE